MSRRIHYFLTLVLAMLGLIMGGAHVLELAPKLGYSTEMYQEVTSTLYAQYGVVGGPIQVLAIITAACLSWRLRRSAGRRLILAGTSCLVLSIVLWAALVQPVNLAWGRLLKESAPEAVLRSYASLRNRWEWGHVAAFIPWLIGAGLLIFAVVFHPIKQEDPPR